MRVRRPWRRWPRDDYTFGGMSEVAPYLRCRLFDFNRTDLPTSGELGPGRVEVSVRYRSFFIVDRTRLQTSIELINLATGFTTVWLPGKPKEIVVIGSSSK